MDIWADNYPFQCFWCFLTLKLHRRFLLTTINHKVAWMSRTQALRKGMWQIKLIISAFSFRCFYKNQIQDSPNSAQRCQRFYFEVVVQLLNKVCLVTFICFLLWFECSLWFDFPLFRCELTKYWFSEVFFLRFLYLSRILPNGQ